MADAHPESLARLIERFAHGDASVLPELQQRLFACFLAIVRRHLEAGTDSPLSWRIIQATAQAAASNPETRDLVVARAAEELCRQTIASLEHGELDQAIRDTILMNSE